MAAGPGPVHYESRPSRSEDRLYLGALEEAVPYLRVTCPATQAPRRAEIASALTEAVVELFTPPRGPSAADIRERTTVHFAPYRDQESFIGGHAAIAEHPDVTVELSDWSMSTRRQRTAAARLTPLLARLFGA